GEGPAGRAADEVERAEDTAVWRRLAGANSLAQRTAGPDVEAHAPVVEDGGEGDLAGTPGRNVVVELRETAAARRALARHRDDRGRRAATLENPAASVDQEDPHGDAAAGTERRWADTGNHPPLGHHVPRRPPLAHLPPAAPHTPAP